jgi:hypothetical protein
MEPVNLKSFHPAADRIEALLRQPAAAPLADGGFTARVLAALPPPRREGMFGWREWLLAGGATGLLLAGGPGVAAGLEDPGTALGGTLAALVTALDQPALLLAAIIIASTLILTVEEEPEAGWTD